MGVWWVERRDVLLVELAGVLVFFGADPLEDPGVGELADAAEILAAEYRTSSRGPHLREVGELLARAAIELRCADRFRGALLPVVVRHLRRAVCDLARARACLRAPAGPAAGAHPGAGRSARSRA
ncbi:hypothetical protein [Kitasatospora camelliae]|uniref:Uncharacterized protein n=1 Tax=Kitasatospora camelliae TaxID=3156397 RepID=A0AAU8KA36_9ACTN